MPASETTTIFHDMAISTGLPPLAIEAIALLAFVFLLFVAILVVEALFRIRREMIRFNLGVGHIVQLIKSSVDKRILTQGHYDFKVDEWKEDTKFVVLNMLQQGDSDDTITKALDVSKAYVNGIRRWAIAEGLLLKRPTPSR